ncbi:hypothetical protein [Variovorax sp. PBL-H6]|uniref:hypothetical protein n=1 Tax=Variovorax sp. PBL-H6 TaxID=434009 RepID=UPI0013A5B4FA|nr:hypothetical protein [Variovorax sp. PBL-H6]
MVEADFEHRFHPKAVMFYSDDPNPDFQGFTKKPVFETNLLFGEMDDDRKYRIERRDGLTFYTRYETGSGMGVCNVSGQALECKEGSPAERAFLELALADAVNAAAEPLQCILSDAREAGLALSPRASKALRASIFPPATK